MTEPKSVKRPAIEHVIYRMPLDGAVGDRSRDPHLSACRCGTAEREGKSGLLQAWGVGIHTVNCLFSAPVEAPSA